jgi:hypothetical protein
MGRERLIIKKLDGGLRGLRNGTKTIEEAKIMYFLGKLAEVNDGLYQDYALAYDKIQKENCV